MLNIKRYTKYALRNIKRSPVNTFVNILVMTFLSFITFVLILGQLNTNKIVNNIENRVKIQVYVDGTATQAETGHLKNEIQNISNVENITYSSKKDQLNKLVEKNGSAFKISDGMDNPTLAVFFVKVQNLKQLEATSQKIRQLNYVDHVIDGGKEIRHQLTMLSNIEHKIIAAELITGLIALVVLFIITKLSIKGKQDIINIQMLVGSTKRFIKSSFIWQGIINSIISFIISLIITIPIYSSIYGKYSNDGILNLVPPTEGIMISIPITLLIIILFTVIIINYSVKIKEKKNW